MKDDKQNSISALATSTWRGLKLALGQPWIPPTAHDQALARGRKLLGAPGMGSESLEAFRSFYGKRAVMGSIIRKRNSTAIFDLIKLSESYEPAKDYLNLLAENIRADMEAGTASDEDMSDWCTMVRHLGQFDLAWELYNTLLDKPPVGIVRASKIASVVYPKLISEKRYKEALETAQENARWALEEVEPATKRADDHARLFGYWLPSAYEAFEVLLANNEIGLCNALEAWALRATPSEAVYDGLIKAARRAENTAVAERLTAAQGS